MYFVKKNGRKTNKTFTTYEAARQWIRKQIRKLTAVRFSGQPEGDMHSFGYTIAKN